MIYKVGDLFVDIRPDTQRNFIITDCFIDGIEPICYEVYTTPENKTYVWSEGMLKLYVDRQVFVHYAVEQ